MDTHELAQAASHAASAAIDPSNGGIATRLSLSWMLFLFGTITLNQIAMLTAIVYTCAQIFFLFKRELWDKPKAKAVAVATITESGNL